MSTPPCQHCGSQLWPAGYGCPHCPRPEPIPVPPALSPDALVRLAALAGTVAVRCLGCGWRVMGDGNDCRCPRYYGTGRRVDFSAWLPMVANDDNGDRPYFDRWAEGEPMSGIPTYWPSDGSRPNAARYGSAHVDACRCGGCLPNLPQLLTALANLTREDTRA